jgi:hypothetical protein
MRRIANELKVDAATLRNWLVPKIRGRRDDSFTRVDIVADTKTATLRVQGPQGVVIEGLDIKQVAELLRALG